MLGNLKILQIENCIHIRTKLSIRSVKHTIKLCIIGKTRNCAYTRKGKWDPKVLVSMSIYASLHFYLVTFA